MAKQHNRDFYGSIEWHLFRIFVLILLLSAMYKVLVVEVPHGALTPMLPTVQSSEKLSCPCERTTVRTHRKKVQRQKLRRFLADR
jgi:hypothetical protein